MTVIPRAHLLCNSVSNVARWPLVYLQFTMIFSTEIYFELKLKSIHDFNFHKLLSFKSKDQFQGYYLLYCREIQIMNQLVILWRLTNCHGISLMK